MFLVKGNKWQYISQLQDSTDYTLFVARWLSCFHFPINLECDLKTLTVTRPLLTIFDIFWPKQCGLSIIHILCHFFPCFSSSVFFLAPEQKCRMKQSVVWVNSVLAFFCFYVSFCITIGCQINSKVTAKQLRKRQPLLFFKCFYSKNINLCTWYFWSEFDLNKFLLKDFGTQKCFSRGHCIPKMIIYLAIFTKVF